MPYIWAPKTPTLAMGRELHIDDTGQQTRAKAHIENRSQEDGGWLWVSPQCHTRYGRGHRRTATAESRWWVLLGACVSRCGFEGMEVSRAGKPGGAPVTDVYVFACLASISSSSGNCTQPIGKLCVSSCLSPSVGIRLMNSNLGTFMERVGRRNSAQRLVDQTDACLRSSRPLQGVWLVQVHVKPAGEIRGRGGWAPAPSYAEAGHLDFFIERDFPFLLLPV